MTRATAATASSSLGRGALFLPFAVTVLLGLTYASVVVQHAAGAYTQGESLWSKGQKDAVIALHRYAARRDPRDLAAARAALAVPLADRRGRLALQAEHPDRAAARRAFAEGGLDPRDTPAMTRLFPLFEHVPAGRRAIAAWTAGDAYIDSLALAALHLERHVTAGSAADVEATMTRIAGIDAQLTEVEKEFSAALADASRVVPLLVLAVGVLSGLVLIAVGRLITRRLAALSAAARSSERQRLAEFRTLVEEAPDIISRFDPAHRHLYVNGAVARVTGLAPEAFVGRTHAELVDEIGFPVAAAAQWDAALARAFETGGEQSLAFDHAPGGGHVRVLEVRLAPERDDDGRVVSVIAIGRDVSALRLSERALRESEERLLRAQKLEAVGQLAGGIAHEFNNVLTAIIGNLEIARDEVPAGAGSVVHDIDEALGAARRATALTRQLLTFGRRQILEPTRVDVGQLVEQLAAMLQRMVGERIALHTDLDPATPAVLADPGQIQQVVLNLVVNARDAMRDAGGVLTIVTAPALGADGRVDAARVSVRDSGIGMDDATRARIFEPFFTTKLVGEGSGLGLAVVDGIVAQAGGRLHVESAPGAGTTVSVFLPALAPDATQPPAPQGTTGNGAAPAPRAGRGETILLVEDEESVRVAMRRMLERSGFRVVEARSAEDALIVWARQAEGSDAIDLVVTDMMMPGLSGAELLVQLARERPSLRALIVSGYTGASLDDMLDTSRLGPEGRLRVATLAKPFAREELLLRIRTLLDA